MIVELSELECKLIIVLVNDVMKDQLQILINYPQAIKLHLDLISKLESKLNSNFEKYQPTEEDREEEITEMKESIIGEEGDR
jgi:hypothetical protein